METQKRTPWRRWIVLVLMIVGFILGGIFVPVQPEITVAAEKLIEEPLIENFLGQPFYLVNTLPTLFVTVFIILLPLAWSAGRSLKKSQETDLVPRGVGNTMEAILEMLYNMTESSAGVKWAKTIFPWFATIMIYVLVANLLKLLPGFESIGVIHHAHGEGHLTQELGNFLGFRWELLSPDKVEEGGYILAPFFRGISVDLNFTLSLALISFFAIQIIGVRSQGIGYFSKFFNTKRMFKVPFFGAMDFLVGLLEIISELAKILSFTFRLFGNMFAGIVLVAVVASLLGKISILPAMIMMFELFVGLIQAFVFGMLTMVFMAMATQGHGDEEHAEH
ncbi:MAG TPA: F0F1 ATP synthase subunit A [Anaerolineales bacterium]|nr:F0F1 ATP synthase subunit A [Anaerolineales bacterium]HMV96272.1 F0F1 ATP synthase subunit A [Anaerolineales bacterium]HMX19103.1 F0F1 ATP synthase subunit A [Anaerolineales bacterium]HMZ42450.1 F0F1 ATP synthase subunit A [Anaerolineales bacterium]HNA54048.1 F0F1 ATP synthase subunit A [Anaerolineales bacterium]